MKKKLIAVALAALASGGAVAQSNVAMYGILDIGLEFANSGFGTKFRLQSGQSAGSRLGFRGNEELGGGNKFIWTLEQGFALDNGQVASVGCATCGSSANNPPINGTVASVQNTAAQTTGANAFARQSWAGVEGDWGKLTFGRQYNPVFLIILSADPFYGGTAAQSSNTLQFVSGFTQRFDNFTLYQTPSINGFDFTAGYTTGSELNLPGVTTTLAPVSNFINGPSATANSLRSKKEGQGYVLAGKYVNGPAYLAAAYTNYYLTSNAQAIGVAVPATLLLGPGVTGISTEAGQVKTGIVAGRYDFGMVQLSLTYMKGEITQAGVSGKLADNSGYTLGIWIPFGTAHKILGVYGARDDKTAANKDYTEVGVGYEYAWSKRTAVYASYGRLNIEPRFTATGAPAGAGAIQNSASNTSMVAINSNYDPRAVQMGVRHSF